MGGSRNKYRILGGKLEGIIMENIDAVARLMLRWILRK
jgi:hypothetical protein